jgi:hypothetical protein
MTIREAKRIVEKAGYRIQEKDTSVEITVYYEIGDDEGDDRPYEEIEFTVIGNVSEYHPATMYDRNGDPGDPAWGGELDVTSIIPNPKDYDIDEDIIIEKAEEELWNNQDSYLTEPSYEDIYDEDDDPEFFRH